MAGIPAHPDSRVSVMRAAGQIAALALTYGHDARTLKRDIKIVDVSTYPMTDAALFSCFR